MVSLHFVFCWSWIQSESQVGLHIKKGSGLLPVVPFGRIIMSMSGLPKYFCYKFPPHNLWLPHGDTLLTCSVQWDLIIPGTLRENRSAVTMQDLLNTHTSSGLRADGSLYSLKSVAGVETPLCSNIFSAYSRKMVVWRFRMPGTALGFLAV